MSGFQSGPDPDPDPDVAVTGELLRPAVSGFLLLYTEFRYIFSEHIFPKHFCGLALGLGLSPSHIIYVYFHRLGIPQFGRIIMLSGGIRYGRHTRVILLLPAGITNRELNA